MTQNGQETMELFLGPFTRARARMIKEHGEGINNGLLTFIE